MIWLVKRKRYDESETVVTSTTTRPEAEEVVLGLNEDSQSNRYYVEAFEPGRSWHGYHDTGDADCRQERAINAS